MTLSPRETIRKASGIGFATLISRILGFVRDVLMARLFGTSAPAQAFAVAFRFPNLLRDLVGEGAANAALVPILTEERQHRPQEFWTAAGTLFNLMAIVLAGLALAGWVTAPWIVRVAAPGFVADPDKFALTVRLTQWLFPYLWFIGLTAVAGGILNTLQHFTAPAYGPCLLNVAMITSVVIAPRFPEPVMVLAVGILAGGALQLGVQLLVLVWRGWRPGAPRRLTHPVVPQAVRLLGPRAVGSGVYQLNLLVDTICASLESIVGSGAVAALYYANRLFQFPLAIVGTALAQATLPTLASQALDPTPDRLRGSMTTLLKLTVFLAIPATVGLMVLGETIVTVLFERGEFTAHSTRITSQALVWYALGLTAYMGAKILTNGCYALQDTRAPVRAAAVALGVNLVLNLLLMWPMGVGGLALATSVASICNMALLWRALRRHVGSLQGFGVWTTARRVLIASAIMGAVCGLGQWGLHPWLHGPSLLLQGASLAGLIAGGIGVFALACHGLRVEELSHLPWISARK